MRKLLVIPVLLLYLPGVSGVTVMTHYCCGERASVEIYHTVPHEHAAPGNDCCNDITCFFKIHDAQQAAVSELSLRPPVLPVSLFPPVTAFNPAWDDDGRNQTGCYYPPPWLALLPLFFSNEALLI